MCIRDSFGATDAKFRPCFVTFDVATWTEVLGISPTESRKASLEASAKKRKQEKQDGTYLSVKEKKALKQAEMESKRMKIELEKQHKKEMLKNETVT